MLFSLFSSTTTTATTHLLLLSLSKLVPPLRFTTTTTTTTAMSSAINLHSHAFAGNPIKPKTPKSPHPFSPISSLETLKSRLFTNNTPLDSSTPPIFRVLPFRKGRPLAGSHGCSWHLGWLNLGEFNRFLDDNNSVIKLEEEKSVDLRFVYLGAKTEEEDGQVLWVVDVSEDDKLVDELGKKFMMCFVELRTLMVATDWSDSSAMADLAVAGHARALLEWHGTSRFCGHCGSKTVPMEAGRRVQCSNELCKKRVYPRVDPVVIMLIIDKENDRALLSRQSRYVPRMWSCLAGFLEPGESLEEAVRRETWEETGIEVGEVVYHSSQPGPVGPSSMPCQLMVGFFAYAKSLEIVVDKDELEDARWHSREEVRKAFSIAEYEKAQRTAAAKVEEICKGVKQSQNLASDFNTESGELAPMFFPGPFAIAHHLISTWVFQGVPVSSSDSKQPNSSSLSNL